MKTLKATNPRSNKKGILTTEADTADRIIRTATHLFARRGFEGTSIKAICEEAQVNIAAVHYHFESKEGLYNRIIHQFLVNRLELASRVLEHPKSLDDFKLRLSLFLSGMIESILKQPELFLIIQREMELVELRSEIVFRETMLKLFEFLRGFFNQAKEEGLLKKSIDPFLAAELLMGQTAHRLRIEGWVSQYYNRSLLNEKFRNQWIQHTLEIFVSGVCTEAKLK